MNTADYDRALYYTHRSQWDNLLLLMVRTKDNVLSKKIEHFLHAYQFSHDHSTIEKSLYALLRYVDHANECVVWSTDKEELELTSSLEGK